MPILNMAWKPTDVPAGAKFTVQDINHAKEGEKLGPYPMYLYESHNGYCLYDYERNSYDDSDWYMVVWNPVEKKPEHICFASTRGWTYPTYGSRPDATPEVMAEYNAWKAESARIARQAKRNEQAREIRSFRSKVRELAKTYGFPAVRLLVKYKKWNTKDMEKIMGLFAPRVRNTFKLNLREQVLNWLRDENPKYETPLSRKQMEWLL